MKKIKGLWIVIIIILTVILLVLYFKNKSNQAIFNSSYESYSNGHVSSGYIIYSNGIIKEHNTDGNKKLKSNKISKEELRELKELIKTIEEQYEEKTLQKHEIVIDIGSTTKSIYSNEMKKWIILSSSSKINSSENCSGILSLTEELYNKYLK